MGPYNNNAKQFLKTSPEGLDCQAPTNFALEKIDFASTGLGPSLGGWVGFT